MAENEQDVAWFSDWAVNFDHREVLGSYIHFIVGEFDWDGKLDVFEEEFEMKEVAEDGYCFVETDTKEHSGKEGKVVGVDISGHNDWLPEMMVNILKKTYLKELEGYEKWKTMLKKDRKDRYEEVIDFEKKHL